MDFIFAMRSSRLSCTSPTVPSDGMLEMIGASYALFRPSANSSVVDDPGSPAASSTRLIPIKIFSKNVKLCPIRKLDLSI